MTSTPDAAAEGYDRLPDGAAEFFGEEATAAYAYDLLTVDVPAASWTAALETARDRLGCTYFDWLSAVDEPGTGFRVCAHVAALSEGRVRRLLIRTTVPHEAAVLPTAIDVYAGAAWHERETHEMFGIGFEGHPHLVPLLLPEGFEGHPLRKDFVLAARVAKAWPGAKEPGESEHGGPKRRTMLPPGVPDPNEWGPLKGQLPPAPSRPARAARAAGDRPVRRTRSVSEGSAGQRQETAAPAAGAESTPAAPPRRTRSASQGSASQQREATEPATGATKPAPEPATGATQPATGAGAGPTKPATGAGAGPTKPATGAGAGPAQPTQGSADAPWHHARPAFDTTPEPSSGPGTSQPQGTTEDNPDTPNRPGTPSSSPAKPEQPETETPDRTDGGDTA
ncbi:NADH-quinone oxidoreductase subunit C [Streptomyces sp. NBC_01618]|uniref:NADH-quinone oxidoreductase subunit C n=1 Tax=Streptomyces sp. NBC_01618 TaxID=2975900 RepID=UPI00386A9AC5|nr:NADH-quinone oxidoreductase subunit C [Streptomyces sp. NBC_01618]